MNAPANPHLANEPHRAGAALDDARLVAVLVHGRGQDEQVMLEMAERIGLDDVAYLLPTAAGRSWYPNRYYEPVTANQPELGWAIAAVDAAIEVAHHAGRSDEEIVLCGFSQGGCLLSELVAANPRPLAGVAILTGSLLGPAGQRVTPAPAAGLPMYISCSRQDLWVAIEDTISTARAFEHAGANVVFEALEDREHLISDRALAGVETLLTA